MNILYGVQGTGNGHISKSTTIYSILKKYSSNVDVLIAGHNYSLQPKYNVKFRHHGISFQTKKGRIDYIKSIRAFKLKKLLTESSNIPFKNFDIIISDFEAISAWGSMIYNIPSIQISHQAAFFSKNVPRPKKRDFFGEFVLKNFAPTSDYIGIHFKKYSENISEPIIKESVIKAISQEKDHITVYLPWQDDKNIFMVLNKIKEIKFQVFSGNIKIKEEIENITFFPVDDSNFSNSLCNSYGVICNSGFETPSEAIYLGKRLMTIPLLGQYEQICNAVALREFGIKSINSLNENSAIKIKKWLECDPVKVNFSNNIEELLRKKIKSKSNL